jgi:hypothetical protein
MYRGSVNANKFNLFSLHLYSAPVNCICKTMVHEAAVSCHEDLEDKDSAELPYKMCHLTISTYIRVRVQLKVWQVPNLAWGDILV